MATDLIGHNGTFSTPTDSDLIGHELSNWDNSIEKRVNPLDFYVFVRTLSLKYYIMHNENEDSGIPIAWEKTENHVLQN